MRAILLGLCALIMAAAAPRPAADVARDPARKPAEVLAFAGVRPGWKVGEYTPGGGYFTRVLAAAVGADGRVYAYPPAEIVRLLPNHLTDAQAIAAAAPNVTVLTGPTAAFAAPEPLDLVFSAQNYHDLHTRFAPPGAAAAFNNAVFAALKRGGRYVIVDHAAQPGTGAAAADKLHRIDPAVVRAEIEAAGFVFDGEAAVLANPQDPRTASVFDPSVRGATDQFAYRFRKP